MNKTKWDTPMKSSWDLDKYKPKKSTLKPMTKYSKRTDGLDKDIPKVNAENWLDKNNIGPGAILGAAQAVGGLAYDLSTSKPDPIKPVGAGAYNALAMETKNASDVIASKIMNSATARADKDYASASSEVRRTMAGNAAAAMMGLSSVSEVGQDMIGKAGISAAGVSMEGIKASNELRAKAIQDVQDAANKNFEMDSAYYMQKKGASADLMGAGLTNMIGSIDELKYKKDKKKVEDDNEAFKKEIRLKLAEKK